MKAMEVVKEVCACCPPKKLLGFAVMTTTSYVAGATFGVIVRKLVTENKKETKVE